MRNDANSDRNISSINTRKFIIRNDSSSSSLNVNMYRNRVVCPSHPDANLIEDHHAGDMICPMCGLVVGDRVIDVSSEWRTFSNDSRAEDRSRVGGLENLLLGGNDLFTLIGPPSGESGRSKYLKMQKTSVPHDALVNAFSTISDMCDRLRGLPRSVSDRAKELFKRVHEARILRGKSHEVIASACIYIACRQEKAARSFKDITAVCSASKKEISRCFKVIISSLGTKVCLTEAQEYMGRYCGNLGLSKGIQRTALTIAKRAHDLDLATGRSPVSVAAAAIYMASQASDDKRSKREIGAVCGVAEQTINIVHVLLKHRAEALFLDK